MYRSLTEYSPGARVLFKTNKACSRGQGDTKRAEVPVQDFLGFQISAIEVDTDDVFKSIVER